jgi:hypothetical protein
MDAIRCYFTQYGDGVMRGQSAEPMLTVRKGLNRSFQFRLQKSHRNR